MIETIFSTICGLFAAVLFWAAVNLDEPFFICLAVFSAGFWGAMAALCVWTRISEMETSNHKPSVIWPHGRRP